MITTLTTTAMLRADTDIANSNHSTNIALEPTLYERIAHKIATTTALTTMLRKRNVSNNAYERIQNVLLKTDENDVIESQTYSASDANQISSNHNSNDGNLIKAPDGENNLAATITSIRSNVTRVLNNYFQYATDEYGNTTTATTMPTTNASTNLTTATMASAIAQAPPTDKSIILATANSANAQQQQQSHSALSAINKIATTMWRNATTAVTNAILNANTTETTATATAAIGSPTTLAPTTAVSLNSTVATNLLTTAPSITYPTYSLTIRSFQNCSDLFANYTQPQDGIFCNWTWDQFLCWPPTPGGVLARMHCPEGWHGIDTKKFANRKCELDGHWGSRPNETSNGHGWTDYQPCFKPEVNELMQQMKHLDTFLDIAERTRYLEIVGLVLSLLALIISLIIFCNFRSLRNNRTKIHKNLFIAMVLQVVVRLTLYLDQAFQRGTQPTGTNTSFSSIENTPYLCEALYVLLEYARTAMFMWMFIEGLYLHMVTVAFFQGRFPFEIFSSIGWGMPVIMTTIWAVCTAAFTDSQQDCWWNYNLTPYYWILEGPRLIVILLNFFFLINIICVLVMKLRQSQASDIEQTRKAVRAAIVLLPLLGITNLLHLVPDLNASWKFALWSYVTHFLTSFQGFFIALIYCFLNGEVRTVLLKSLAVYMSVRGHPEWVPKRASMYSAAYNTAPETEAQLPQDSKRFDSPPHKRNGRKPSTSTVVLPVQLDTRTNHITTKTNTARTRLSLSASPINPERNQGKRQEHNQSNHNNNNSSHIDITITTATATTATASASASTATTTTANRHRHRSCSSQFSHRRTSTRNGRSNWMMLTLCFRSQKNKCVMSNKNMPQQIFMTTKANTIA